jgi:hypothetical protein
MHEQGEYHHIMAKAVAEIDGLLALRCCYLSRLQRCGWGRATREQVACQLILANAGEAGIARLNVSLCCWWRCACGSQPNQL